LKREVKEKRGGTDGFGEEERPNIFTKPRMKWRGEMKEEGAAPKMEKKGVVLLSKGKTRLRRSRN